MTVLALKKPKSCVEDAIVKLDVLLATSAQGRCTVDVEIGPTMKMERAPSTCVFMYPKPRAVYDGRKKGHMLSKKKCSTNSSIISNRQKEN